MKLRNDFVSNSSSSSYIVISNTGKYWKSNDSSQYEPIELPTSAGCKEYGWQTEKYYDVWDKLNWCTIVILTLHNLEKGFDEYTLALNAIKKPWYSSENMINMLKTVCKNKMNLDIAINPKLLAKYDYFEGGYIDHQSNITDTPENARMFLTEDMLYDFIANSNSYIDNSNDNGGRDDDNHSYDIPADYTI